jgi:hypothetical protein
MELLSDAHLEQFENAARFLFTLMRSVRREEQDA